MFKLKFSDLLIAIMVGVVFGITMKFWDDLYTVVKPILPVARQLLYGMWFMVGPFAFLLIRKPGVALISSLAAAGLSAFIGQGFTVLIYGLVQGLAAEALFASFRYKKFGIAVAGLAGIASCFAGFFLDWFYGYANLEVWALFVKYGLRVISAFIFTGIFTFYIVRALEATGVTNMIRPVSKEEYDLLNNS
ncbi:ECF transporter S component [Sporosarcina sp. FA9]|uniref:ECF transporter S component n=1 Tax=Sporosarcina sp. FA9 TaxID=3413030 RepID=UPI003F65E968